MKTDQHLPRNRNILTSSFILITSTSQRAKSLRLLDVSLQVKKKKEKRQIKGSIRNQTVLHLCLLHTRPSSCAALHCLAFCYACCFLHEQKQRALSFSRLAFLLINRGHRATRRESSLRACSTRNNAIASRGDACISQCSVAA